MKFRENSRKHYGNAKDIFHSNDPFQKISKDRRLFLKAGAVGLANLVLPLPVWAAPVDDDLHRQLTKLSQLSPQTEPLLTFRDFQTETDPEIESLIMRDISGRPGLLGKVREKIGSDKRLGIQVDNLKVRLLFVPELRENYASSYASYCQRVTSYVFDKTNSTNFYHQILNPQSEYPPIPQEGVSAFLVHQLGKEYVATCTFSNGSGNSVRYRIKGAVFSRHKGAVDLEIENPAPGDYLLKRKNYTIWQNQTEHPFTLFAIPVEETFHYLLGPHTDKKIQDLLLEIPDPTVSDVRRLASHWMMVEEAAVGGLVHLILGQYSDKYALPVSSRDMESSIQRDAKVPQFKYRPKGIQLVRDLGCMDAVNMYKADPGEFESRLTGGGRGSL